MSAFAKWMQLALSGALVAVCAAGIFTQQKTLLNMAAILGLVATGIYLRSLGSKQ